MSIQNTPGVKIQEVTTLAPSVVPVETAIPAFIGYTQFSGDTNPTIWPAEVNAVRVTSFLDYYQKFGGPFLEFEEIAINPLPTDPGQPSFWLYYQLQMFYANGGGPCYIVSVNEYFDENEAENTNVSSDLENGLNALEKEDEPTLILIPDAIKILGNEPDDDTITSFYNLYQMALNQCAKLKNRFTIIDLHRGDLDLEFGLSHIEAFRTGIGENNLNYGATYYPWLETTLHYPFDDSEINITGDSLIENLKLKYDTTDLSLLDEIEGISTDHQKKSHYEARSLFHTNITDYMQVKKTLDSFRIKLPPGGAMAGIYAKVDNIRGVHKAPANVSLAAVIKPLVQITDENQSGLNIPTSGKAINAIRFFSDRGKLVWGTRTLDALSNEWRYINVRRFFIFAEESIKRAIEPFVFEPNDANTWVRVKGMIENFLLLQWKEGALTGSKPKQAFFVQVGLGTTMTALDILDGRLIVSVGMAVARPAEFIVLKFIHKLQEA